MEAYFGSHFKADEQQSNEYKLTLDRRMLIMEDGSLKGRLTPTLSELWCYVYYLWSSSNKSEAMKK
jgi:hypothetical protein